MEAEFVRWRGEGFPTVLRLFPDGEFHVEIQESVRGRDIYLIQSTSPPAEERLLELLLLADACRRGDAGQLTAVIPYFGYARGRTVGLKDESQSDEEGFALPVSRKTICGDENHRLRPILRAVESFGLHHLCGLISGAAPAPSWR